MAASKVGRSRNLAVVLNLEGESKSQIETRSTATVHYGDATCSGDNFLERSHNVNHGIGNVLHGKA